MTDYRAIRDGSEYTVGQFTDDGNNVIINDGICGRYCWATLAEAERAAYVCNNAGDYPFLDFDIANTYRTCAVDTVTLEALRERYDGDPNAFDEMVELFNLDAGYFIHEELLGFVPPELRDCVYTIGCEEVDGYYYCKLDAEVEYCNPTSKQWVESSMFCSDSKADFIEMLKSLRESSFSNKNGHEFHGEGDFEAAVELMDDEIREELNDKLAPCSMQKFFSAYEKAHEEKFGEEWELSKANPVW